MTRLNLKLKNKLRLSLLAGTAFVILFSALITSGSYPTTAQAATCIPTITNFKVTPTSIPTNQDSVIVTYTVTSSNCLISDAERWKSAGVVYSISGEYLQYGLSHDLKAFMFKKTGTTYSAELKWEGKIFRKVDTFIPDKSIYLRPRMYQGETKQAEFQNAQVLIKIDPKAPSPSGTTGGIKTPAPTVVKNPGNLNNSTGEEIDESGGSGFVFCGNTVDTPCNITHLFRTMIVIINYLISMVGLIAILFIVIAGVQMIISQGAIPGKAGDETQLTAAKKRLGGAVTGIVLVAIAFVLVNSLLAGSLRLGILNGAQILTNPKAYINQCETDENGSIVGDCNLPSEANPNPKPTTQTQGTTPKEPITGD